MSAIKHNFNSLTREDDIIPKTVEIKDGPKIMKNACYVMKYCAKLCTSLSFGSKWEKLLHP